MGERSQQSLFSLLLQIESRLRAEVRQDALLHAEQLKRAKAKNLRGVEKLSHLQLHETLTYLGQLGVVTIMVLAHGGFR